MISWDRVHELRDEIGEEDFAEVAELFLTEVEEVIERLRARPSPDTMEEDMHFLKGSALNLGFAALSRLCRDNERIAAEGRAGDVVLETVFQTYEASKEQFLAEA